MVSNVAIGSYVGNFIPDATVVRRRVYEKCLGHRGFPFMGGGMVVGKVYFLDWCYMKTQKTLTS